MIQILPYSVAIPYLIQVFEKDTVTSTRITRMDEKLILKVLFRNKRQAASNEFDFSWIELLYQVLDMKRKRRD